MMDRSQQALAKWVFQNLIVPLWNTIILPVFKAIGNVISRVVNITASALKTLISTTADVASYLFQNVITRKNGFILGRVVNCSRS
jgi:hypothetical protein